LKWFGSEKRLFASAKNPDAKLSSRAEERRKKKVDRVVDSPLKEAVEGAPLQRTEGEKQKR
jgi:hypothetical protein